MGHRFSRTHRLNSARAIKRASTLDATTLILLPLLGQVFRSAARAYDQVFMHGKTLPLVVPSVPVLVFRSRIIRVDRQSAIINEP